MKIRIPPKWEILYCIMLFAICKPAYLPSNAVLLLYRGLQACTLGYLLLYTLRKKLVNYQLIFIFTLYYGFLFFSTILNSGSIGDWFQEVLTTYLVILWMHTASQKGAKPCLRMLMLVFEFLIYVNMVTVLLYPSGLYQSVDAVVSARYGWFLGHQSLFSMYAGPAICVAAMRLNNEDSILQKVRSLLLIVACVVQTFILGSANNLICLLVIALGTVIMSVFNMKEFPIKTAFIGVATLVLVICVFQATSFMEPFVVNYLHRSMTFTDRTFIWEKAIIYIKDNFFLGCGVQNDEMMRTILGVGHAHNQYLQCFLIGGVFLLGTFIAICYKAFNNIRPYAYTFAGRVMVSTVVALLIQMIFEVYFHHTMGKMLIVLSYYFAQLCYLPENDEKLLRRYKKARFSRRLKF